MNTGNEYRDELGEPHLDLAGLQLWIHGYQFPKANDYWDGNWLKSTAICSANGASVLIQGSFIRTNEIEGWGRAVETLDAKLEGEAILECMEPEISVKLTVMSQGAVKMEVRITPDHLNQEHGFTFTIDQSYLKPLASQCTRLLYAFPIRGA